MTKQELETGHKAAATIHVCSKSRRSFLLKSGALLGMASLSGVGSIVNAVASDTVSGGANASGGSPLYAYVGSRTTRLRNALGKGIEVYRFSPDSGNFEHVQQVTDLVNPSYLVVDSAQRHLYAVHGDTSRVSAFSIDPQTGKLSFINDQYTGGSNPVHLTLNKDDNFLIVANYSSGTVSLLPVDDDGGLGELVDVVKLKVDLGPNREEQAGPKPHQVQFDPSHRWLIVPAKGLDKVMSYELDEANQKLVLVNEVSTRSGAGPRHIAFHPTAPYGYVVNELDSSVTSYDFDNETGQLTPKQIVPALPQSYTGNNTSSAIFTSPDGKYLYASNRGHHSIFIGSISQGDGLLETVGWQDAQGKKPRFFTLDPTGNWLLAANEASHSIVPFQVSHNSGELSQSGQIVETGSPVSISFASPSLNK